MDYQQNMSALTSVEDKRKISQVGNIITAKARATDLSCKSVNSYFHS